MEGRIPLAGGDRDIRAAFEKEFRGLQVAPPGSVVERGLSLISHE
jgi:hypothetical protein